jgi:hypothetical protein
MINVSKAFGVLLTHGAYQKRNPDDWGLRS